MEREQDRDETPCSPSPVGPGVPGHVSASAALVNAEFVRTKCEYFVDVQLWPVHEKLNPDRWLSNFDKSELPYALQLLNSFLYYNELLTEKLFAASIQGLSRITRRKSEPLLSTQSAWRAFLDNAVFTRVTGEKPSDTDSGFRFARMARQVINIDENRVLGPEAALEELIVRPTRPVIFLCENQHRRQARRRPL